MSERDSVEQMVSSIEDEYNTIIEGLYKKEKMLDEL